MSTLFTETPVETPSESATTIGEARVHLAALAAEMGVPTLAELMALVDETVFQMHGPTPATPTWEEVVESWTATQLALEAPAPQAAVEAPKDEIVDAEIVEDEPAPITTGRAAAKALPAAKPRTRKRPAPKAIAAK